MYDNGMDPAITARIDRGLNPAFKALDSVKQTSFLTKAAQGTQQFVSSFTPIVDSGVQAYGTIANIRADNQRRRLAIEEEKQRASTARMQSQLDYMQKTQDLKLKAQQAATKERNDLIGTISTSASKQSGSMSLIWIIVLFLLLGGFSRN